MKPRRNNVLNELIKNFQDARGEYNAAHKGALAAEGILEVKTRKINDASLALREHLTSLIGNDVLIVPGKL